MDTKFFSQALKNWQDEHDDVRGFGSLSPAQQSEIAREAQDLKKHNPELLSPEGLRNREACEAILRRR